MGYHTIHQRQQEDLIMLDINKAINNARLLETDPEGNLFDLEHWSPLVAQQLAKAEKSISPTNTGKSSST